MTSISELSPTVGRRELLIGAGAALLGVAVTPPGREFVAGVADAVASLGSAAAFDRSEVLARVGESWRVVAGPAAGTVIVITAVTDLLYGETQLPEGQFSVRFRTAGGSVLSHDTYQFVTQSFGRLPLFVTPITDGTGTVTGYEAIVNRFVPSDAEGARP